MTTIEQRRHRASGVASADGPRAGEASGRGERVAGVPSARCWRRASRVAMTFGVMLMFVGVGAAPGSAAGANTDGADLLRSLEAGEQSCQELSDGEFKAIGEYVIGRMVGSTARHDAMDEQMPDATDEAAEARAHVFMGQRFSDCATGDAPEAFGAMMSMMGNYSGASSMGMGSDGRYGNGSRMMGDSGWRSGDGDGRDGVDGNHMGGSWGWLVIVAMLAMMGGMVWMMVSMTRGARHDGRGPSEDPVDLLKLRYARGDVSTDEFLERRQAIEDARR